MIQRQNFDKDGAPKHPISEPTEGPGMVSPGSTLFHLPRSLLNPDQDITYGFKTFRCGGVDDHESIYRAQGRGWMPVNSSEVEELKVAPGMNIFADAQDNLVRVQGTVLMKQKRDAKNHWDTIDGTLMKNYESTIARYRKPHKEDNAGPEAGRGFGVF